MSKTALQLVQDFTDFNGLGQPGGLVGSTDATVKQYLAMLNRILTQIKEYSFEEQKIRKTWVGVATQDQGTLTALFGSALRWIVRETGWNDTRRMRIFGPVSDATWQALQVLPNAGPEFQMWLGGSHLYISPAPKAGETLSMIVYTRNLVLAGDAVTTKEFVTADSDTFLLPDIVIQQGLQYVWSKQKGVQDWEDEYNTFISTVAKNNVKDGDVVLRMDLRDTPSIRPGIVIPAGSWNVQSS